MGKNNNPAGLTVNNRYPDCLRLGLEVTKLSASEVLLSIDTTFSHAWVAWGGPSRFWIKNFRINFAIKEVDLSFTMHGLTSPPEKRRFRNQIAGASTGTATFKETASSGTSKTYGLKATLGVDAEGPSGSVEPSLAIEERRGTATEQGATYGKDFPVVQESGDIRMPKWSFQSRPGEHMIQGSFVGELAECILSGRLCSFEATMEISHGGIHIRDVELDGFEIPSPKKKVAIFVAARKAVREECRDWISRAEWSLQHA